MTGRHQVFAKLVQELGVPWPAASGAAQPAMCEPSRSGTMLPMWLAISSASCCLGLAGGGGVGGGVGGVGGGVAGAGAGAGGLTTLRCGP